MTEPADWHPEDIKAAVRKSGLSCEALSVQHGYGVDAVRIACRKPWPAVQAIVAAHLGILPQSIWPSRYDQAGEPIRRRPGRPKKEHKARLTTPHRISRRAA